MSRHTVTPLETPCQVWEGARSPDGYGTKRVDGKTYKTHRLAWVFAFGEIPEGLCVLHRCDNPPCLNPDHLFLGTHSDNMQDRANKGRNEPRGSAHGNRKLDDERVLEMRRRHAAGEEIKALAQAFGVSEMSAGKICRRKAWKHLP